MACVLLAAGAAWGGDESAPTATRPAAAKKVPRSRTPEAIERTAKYYLELYGKYLRTQDPIARAMVVVSLARLDDPRCTEKLIHVMLRDRAPLVRVYAWEALHARIAGLTPVQRTQWMRAGTELNGRKLLRGDLRRALVGAMKLGGPTPANRSRFKALFGATSSRNRGDIRTLAAMGDLLAEWKSSDLVKYLVDALREHNTAWRAEYVLRRISAKPKRSGSMYREGSVVVWARMHAAWAAWQRAAGLRQAPVEPGEYDGRYALLPAGEKITDAADPKWRGDLELEKFSLRQLDVGFLIDSTGSMGPLVRWIQSDVVRIMRAFEIISREPRIGVTFYRDYGDDYVVKPIPLSGQADTLAKAMKPFSAKGGGDIPEAVYAGLSTMLKAYRWSGRSGKKVVVVLGDAPPHAKYAKMLDGLIKAGVKRGFVFYAVKIKSRYRSKRPNYDPQLATFDHIAALGGGKSFWVNFYDLQMEHSYYGVARPRSENSPERIILREVLKAAMAKGYENRVNDFVNVLEQFIEPITPEKRSVIRPHKPSKHRPSPPSKPRDPQAR